MNPIIINNTPLPLINKAEISSVNYDLIVVVGQNSSLVPILKEAEELKINPDKVILDRTICVPGFTMERYKKLRHSKLSIFSSNCWGGVICNVLGLPFLSPTVNMFYDQKEFLKFLKSPKEYMDKELRYYKMGFDKYLQPQQYPIFLLDDVKLYMNHYGKVGADIARQKWEERRLRINWYNLLVMMYTENPDIASEFDKLPYSKKVCFVNFKTNLDSAFYIDSNLFPGRPLWEIILRMPKLEMTPIFDYFDMLLYGKKTPLKIVNN